ncbi:hypothetical protein [Rhizobium ruizarguesonis]|uniref:hypothetical protein n=1 Tax=Rhizobium ruizarguesonis TaxID=2081791 RepID=UPI001030090D|nr:hypothetical protein [Rhizobium ruizarguesonis]TAZ66881.1 hypothetical protein ELH68_33825 [Rhizobium ruizarguesonis]TAZ89954.1 hypothetical protein ELH64_34175 [Rhizobium ruizarguesonis]TBA10653.1 hypothetical protein ELH61_34220 [Rhizobium ruizarguesonis]TBA54053.1 hypothetical protein ELH57_31115 [Rhizobium ruizarguesonis]TBB40553.1 hypothetical protein ELH44_34200 [Rhizobium ruizarguesonis]
MTIGNISKNNRTQTFSRSTALILALSISLAGCAGREARPVASTNPSDSAFDCAGITREFDANERQITSTVKERTDAQGKNIVLGATGVLLFLPALFFMDPKSPEKVEIDALRNRNKVLSSIAKSKGCQAPKSQLTELYKHLDAKAKPASSSDSRN